MSEERKAVLDDMREWQALVESRAWKRLVALAEEQCKLRTDSIVLSPLSDASGVYEQEFKKGEVSGIALFVEIPRTSIEMCRTELARLDAEEPKEA